MRIRRYRSLVARLLIAFFGLAQAALPGASAVADATLGMGATPSFNVAHAEDSRQPGCQFVHGPECVLCAVLNVLAAAPRPPFDELVASRARLASAAPVVAVATPPLLAAHPRGPPSV